MKKGLWQRKKTQCIDRYFNIINLEEFNKRIKKNEKHFRKMLKKKGFINKQQECSLK